MAELNRGLAGDETLARRLIIEITEASAMSAPTLARAFMHDLRGRGISFALDDFGAGNTSFGYFRTFRFDIVKIDGQFIRNIHKDSDNQVLLAALCSLAQHFNMFTVAEQVETQAERRNKWGGAVLQHQKWGGAVLQISALELQQFCVKPFVGHANLIRCRYWRLEERRDGAVSRVVSVFFVQFIYCVTKTVLCCYALGI